MRIQDRFDIILFDGVCNLCNSAVDFVIRRDKNDRFKFGALQDNATKSILKDYKINEGYIDSIILLRGNEVFYKSKAALEITKNLGGFWPILYVFNIVPSVIRDPIYDWIAKNRYKWFGKKQTCRIPNSMEREKFL
ncbi:thiol-disulfide oxidoreductase DCC family protein [Aquiflexum gelatinilyticum]|uniref:thiol-disulfide oxidoreductase DCC family protein n=1 Tax=Aquiflexum gelatinilyticum TaxID=2961943 RepID=UPI002169D85E|nr:DCC1-like thiol-disulfide oxidoreductase family protein [Aquiflexum gelatinilyticum]MCS4436503.1 DCC1-like thiol-disulfide oxidoreductase family protein [Aquiflexum gelatinilyticum]